MKRKRRDATRGVTIGVLVVGLLAAWLWQEFEDRAALDALSDSEVRCTRVIDGDTIDVRRAGDTLRVRLMGIDCPETHNQEKGRRQARELGLTYQDLVGLGKQATRRTRESLEGKAVTLVFEGDDPPLDDYGRALCYVEVDGHDHGEGLLLEGLAYTRREPHPRMKRYKGAAKKVGQ